MKKTKKIAAFLSSLMLLSSMSALGANAAYSETYKLGDVNQDGIVDSSDLSLLKKGIFYLTPLTDAQKRIADINGDHRVTYSDVLLLTLDVTGAKPIAGEVTITYDDNGNVVDYLNDNENYIVSSNGYTASVSNTQSGSLTSMSNYYLSNTSENGSIMITPWYGETKYSSESSDTVIGINDYYSSAKTVVSSVGKAINTGISAWGTININNDFFDEDEAPFMRNTYNYFRNANKADASFADSSCGVDETVSLINAEITKRADGIEFVNHVSDDTVNAFMADDYVTVDGVTLSYSEGEFTVEGIADDETELIHTMTVGQYDEIAVITNTPGQRYIYGLMYDTATSSMAALVKVRLDKNMEATVIQYSKAADMATTINFYPKDYVYEKAMNNLDEIVTLFDNDYDAEHLVFQTVHFPRRAKNALIGALNNRYQITKGITFKQSPNASGSDTISIKSSYETAASTLTFNTGSDDFSIENTERGNTVSIVSSADSIKYTSGQESFTAVKSESNKYFTPDTAITYNFGDSSETFTVSDVLSQRTPTLY